SLFDGFSASCLGECGGQLDRNCGLDDQIHYQTGQRRLHGLSPRMKLSSYSMLEVSSCAARSKFSRQQRSSQDRNTRKGTSLSLRFGQTSQYASRNGTACSKTGTSRPSDISFWAR